MNPRALFLVSASVVAGFALGRLSAANQGPISKVASVKPDVESGGSDDPLGSALAELTGREDLASLARLGFSLDRLDSEQMKKLLDRLERNPARYFGDLLAWLFSHWVKRDPSAAGNWIRPRLNAAAQDGPPGHSFDASERGRMILAWAKADPKAALEYAKEHFRTGLAGKLLDEVIKSWPEKEPKQRLAVIQEFPAGKARDEALRNLLWHWAGKEPSAALAVAQSIGSSTERSRALNYVLKQLVERDPKAAFEQYLALGLDDPYLLSRAMSKGAEKDPHQAVEWLASLSPGQFARSSPLVVEKWAERDPAAALSWALENGVALATHSDFRRTLNHDGLSRSTTTSMTSINPLAKAFAAKPEDTMAWIHSLPPGSERERLLELSVAYTKTTEQGTALFNELEPDAATRTAALFAARFDNVSSGRAWVESLPPGPARIEAWRGLGAIDSEGSIDLPPGPERDAVLSGRAFTFAGRSTPIPRLELISQISDPTLKRDLFEQALEESAPFAGTSYLRQALDLLESSDFPEDWKQSWRSMAK